LGAYSIVDGKDLLGTFTSWHTEIVKNEKGEEKECFIATFKELDKPMIVNKVNRKILEALYGEKANGWIGKRVLIYAKPNVKSFGGVVDALRFREKRPDKPVMVKDSTDWKNVVKYVGTAGAKIEAITSKFEVPKDLLTELNTMLNGTK